jgi:rhomboid protease GluP
MELSSILESPAAWAIAAINVLWFLFVTAHGDTTNVETLIRFGANERVRIWKHGESWRLITACFLHIGWIHLIWNTYMMFGLCQRVELHLGTVRFLLAYLVSGIGGSAISVMGHRVVSAGASGAGFGMIGVEMMLVYRAIGDWSTFLSSEYVLHNVGIMVVWFLIGAYLIRMDNFAHGGGLLFGLMAGYALTLDEGHPLRLPVLIVVIAVWIGTVLMSLNPRFARKPEEPDIV